MLWVEEPASGKRQTVMLLDPDQRRWPARLRDRQTLPPHPRVCALSAAVPGRVRHGSRTLYYVGAESLTGWTVLDELAREGVIRPVSRAVRLCIEAAEALSFSHEAGLAHGHLEPGCLFIQTYADEDPGHIKLLGLGLQVVAPAASRAARYRPRGPHGQGEVPRTGAEVQAGDLFALGGVLYHMITGRAPDPDLEDGLAEIDALHGPLGAIVRRALHADPASRYPSALALREALAGLQFLHLTDEDEGTSYWAYIPRWQRKSARA
jgi:serine/threonine protein kinase